MDTLERFRQLAAWLADTDIALLELRGPQTLLRLARDGAAGGEVVEAEILDEQAHANTVQSSPSATTIAAPTVGILRLSHPLHDSPLASIGTHVECGQPLALLQIGHMLVPVTAPGEGVVTRLLADDGDAVGYGDALIELDGLMD